MIKLKLLGKDTHGYIIVEAAYLFPIMIMIFFALVLLAMYLPVRSSLQRATQIAATALATEQSDTWLTFDTSSIAWKYQSSSSLSNVYTVLLNSLKSNIDYNKAEAIVNNVENNSISSKAPTVTCSVVNDIIYKEIIVTASRDIPMPINLSLIGFPQDIPITVSSTAVVQDGAEFERNIDIAVDFMSYIQEKYPEVGDIFKTIESSWDKLTTLFGW